MAIKRILKLPGKACCGCKKIKFTNPDRFGGTLVDGYGIYADPDVAKFIKQVEDINKKVVKE